MTNYVHTSQATDSAAMDGKNYSTADIPTAKRLSAWQEYMSDVYYNVEIRPFDGENVRGKLREVRLDSIGISSFQANSQQCFRSRAAAATDRAENFVFLLPVRNPLQFEQSGRSGQVDVGDIVILNSSEAYRTNVPDDSANITIKISCGEMRERFRDIDRFCARTGEANVGLVPVIRSLGAQLLDMDAGIHTARLHNQLVEMLCRAFEMNNSQQVDRSLTSLADLTLRQLTSYVRFHCGDPGLSPVRVAQANRISVRYLHKLFNRAGMTFVEFLTECRLENAARMLREGSRSSFTRLRIADVSYACGFSSQSHFTARFRRRFGLTPGEAMLKATDITGRADSGQA